MLAINVGSTLDPPHVPGKLVLSMRPLGRLRQAWEALLADFEQRRRADPFTVTVVGGGAAGVEALLGCLARLRSLQPTRKFNGRLVTRSSTILPGFPARTIAITERALERASVDIFCCSELTPSHAEASDLILWATGAQAHGWQRASGLTLSERGFIRVDEYLRSVSHPNVFAVGDCAEWSAPLPKAGVFSVRMGPYLTHNVRVALGAPGTLRKYRPQSRFLVLLATGDRRAIASRGGWSAGSSRLVGRLMWRWKDHIDRKFLSHFRIETQPTTGGKGQPPRSIIKEAGA